MWIAVLVLACCVSDDADAGRLACGINSVTLALNYLGKSTDENTLRRLLPIERAPFSLKELEDAATQMGMKTRSYHWESPKTAKFLCPSILHIRGNSLDGPPDHFVVCFGETKAGLCVAEFPQHPTILSREKLEQIWDGDALYIENMDGAVIDQLDHGFRNRLIVIAIVGMLITTSTILLRRRYRDAMVSKLYRIVAR